MNFKKLFTVGLACVVMLSLVGCTNDKNSSKEKTATSSSVINLISREQGSGTRAAFTEITGILVKENGKEIDKTSSKAAIQSSTNAVLTTVEKDINSIGYISLGSLRDTVKALKIEGAEPTPQNIKNDSYKLKRPFNLAYKENIKSSAKDFLKFILSAEGQKIVSKEGYVATSEGENYTAIDNSDHLTIAGSTSVTPLMEKLTDAYKIKNPNVKIDIQSNGSSAGMTAAIKNTADIGMASRDLKDSEKKELVFTTIAHDGIAVIVNKDNTLSDINITDLKKIFTGEITDYSKLKK